VNARAVPRVSASFRLPTPLHRWLRSYARRSKVSLNEVVVIALEMFRATELDAEQGQ
jgi:predicted HicB family RNase H-like nuclease